MKEKQVNIKILHIIPSGFDYFDDIRNSAFTLMESLNSLGFESDAYTIEYGYKPSKETKEEVKEHAPSSKFEKMHETEDFLSSFHEYHIIHVHCPLLGKVKEVLHFKNKYPDKPIVLSYYEKIKITDLFSIFVKFYNRYNLPKLFEAADKITCFNKHNLPPYLYRKRWIKQGKIEELLKIEELKNLTQGDLDDKILELEIAKKSTKKLLEIYKKLLLKK